MTPELFLIDCREQFPKYPSGNAVIPITPKPACALCGAPDGVFEGNGALRLRGGKKWPDLIRTLGTNGPHFVVAQRVKHALEAFGCRGVRWFSTTLTIDAGPRLPPPEYYWLAVDGRIEIDRVGWPPMPREKRCPRCDTRHEGPYPPQKFAPVEGSWDGSDFFRIANYRSHQVGCSRRVLELARAEKWSNCRFFPIDVLRRHAIYSKGIDYLGRKWPPAEWYPEPKSNRRPYDEWLAWLDQNIHQAAHDPLLDFCPELIGPLRQRVIGGTDLERWNALWALWYAHHDGYALEPEEVSAVEAAIKLPPPVPALRDRLFHGDEAERHSAALGLLEWRKQREVDLLPDEKAAILGQLPALAAEHLE